jgi:prepilin-type N-terminal cleavage/methylation domain-containing protein
VTRWQQFRRNRSDRTASRESGRDRGVTLVEVVITIALMGVVVVPVLSAIRTAIVSSSISESAAEVETMLVNAVDRVHRADRKDFKCDFTAPVEASVLTFGWPASNAVVVHEHFEGGNWQPGGCPGGVFRPGLVQRITISITSPDGDITRTLQVVKGDI